MKNKGSKNILLIGVGGTGSDAVDMIYQKIEQLKNNNGNHISAIVFDTDVGSIQTIKSAKAVPLADNASVGTIVDRVGKKYIKEWFPVDEPSIRSQEMIRGASQWRKKSYLAFLNLMTKPKLRATFTSVLEEMTVDPNASCEVYVISSLAGGTGSGSFIPIALYTKRYLRKNLGKNPIVNAMICLPDIFAGMQTPENRVKVYANAYAILRELNAINLVARNYNDGHSSKKKSPIKIRIGHPEEPNVGVLFDSMDPAYWTPEAAPFSQIFVLDKMPCVNSVKAHNKVLGDSLYSLICTDIGAEIDSEFSNHEIVRSQANGSNAIYASIASSQMHFPKETLLDYLAHKKTLQACDEEWLTLHTATEDQIQQEKASYAEMNRRFVLDNAGYADIFLRKLEDDFENNNGRIQSLVERGTAIIDTDTGIPTGETTVDRYYATLKTEIKRKIPTIEKVENDLKDILSTYNLQNGKKPRKFKGTPDEFAQSAQQVNTKLVAYYKECLEAINRYKSSMMDLILPLNKKKDVTANKDLSLVKNILQFNNLYIHPVSAMVQLCRLRSMMFKDVPVASWKEWTDLKRQDVGAVPAELLSLEEASNSKSGYAQLGTGRFDYVKGGDENYAKKTDVFLDGQQLIADASSMVSNIYAQCCKQLQSILMRKIALAVDTLMNKYKTFFGRFAKEKGNLVEETKTIRARDARISDSIINVFCSEEDKDRVYEDFTGTGDYMSDEELAKADSVSGEGVFKTVYAAAVAEVSGADYNDNDASGFSALFKGMVDSYKEVIKKNDFYKAIAEYNVVEAIEAMSGDDPKALEDNLKSYFTTALERATPSLKIDTNPSENDLVAPSNTLVFMISTNTGKYIKKNAEKFNIHITVGSNDKDSGLVKAAAEQFIKKYSGADSARICIVNTLPDDSTIYCTGETMDITPLRIAKFDELGADNLYFKHYSDALSRMRAQNTDMWNPHIGSDFHKRGNLPYMNEKAEEIGDIKLGKAIIYTLWKGTVTLSSGSGQTAKITNFKVTKEDGTQEAIRGEDNAFVTSKNVSNLLGWYRKLDDEKINEWADLFDSEINSEISVFKNVVTDQDLSTLKTQITKCGFMDALTDEFFAYTADAKGPKPISIIEFAHIIKTSEETIRDNDDAERILRVAYDTFVKLIEAKCNKKANPDRFIEVYRQQVRNVYLSILEMEFVKNGGNKVEDYFKQVISWLNYADFFRDIDCNNGIDQFGEIVFTQLFNPGDDVNNDGAIVEKMNKISGKAKESKDSETSGEERKKPGPKPKIAE